MPDQTGHIFDTHILTGPSRIIYGIYIAIPVIFFRRFLGKINSLILRTWHTRKFNSNEVSISLLSAQCLSHWINEDRLIEAAVALAIAFDRRNVRGIRTVLRVHWTHWWIGVRIPPLYMHADTGEIRHYCTTILW